MPVEGDIDVFSAGWGGNVPTPVDDPVEALAGRLRALNPLSPYAYSANRLDRAGPGTWLGPDEVMAAMLTSNGEHHRFGPAVRGARLAGSLGYAAAGRPAVAIAVAGQVYDPGPDSLVLRLDDAGLVDRIAVRSGVLAVLPDDPRAAAPGIETVGSVAELTGWAARRAYATLDPLAELIHRHTRYGRVAIWNQIADTVLGPTTTAMLPAGRSQEAGRAVGHLFLDALVAEGAPIRRRGTVRVEVSSAGPRTLDPIRGMCCLYYRQDRDTCAGCPLTC